jgi:hypothetical protein
MKKLLCLLIIVSALTLNLNQAKAQAWEKSTKVLALGFGASQFYHLDNYYYSGSGRIHNGYSPVTLQVNFQGEFGIHQYLGLGFTTGIGGRGSLRNDYAGELNIPIGMIFNFHFYQLIADKSAKNIHADKLDIYAGINAGSGIAIAYYNEYYNGYYHPFTRVVPIAFGGVHLGIRYYFTPMVGVNLEAGIGKNLVNAGFVFKM